jgi:hypothetical protein
MCQHCEGYDHGEDKAALGAALIRRQQEKRASVAAAATPHGHAPAQLDRHAVAGTAKSERTEQA